MKINIKDINVTNDMVCKFVDGTSTPEVDRMILARMKIDSEFACEIRDMMDAMNALSEMSEEEERLSELETYPYRAAAFASFAGLGASERGSSYSAPTKSADDLADDFLDGYDDEEEENESDDH